MSDPRDPRATLATAFQLFQAGNLADAERACRAAMVALPRMLDPVHLLSRVLRARGQFDEARALVQAAIGRNGNHPLLREELGLAEQRVPDALGPLAARGLTRPAPAPAADDAKRGAERLAQMDPRGAADAFKAALQKQPDDPVLLTALGTAQFQMGELDHAVVSLRTAVAARPDNPRAMCMLGQALCSVGRFDEGLALIRGARSKRPDFHQALVAEASALGMLGRTDEAMRAAEKVLAVLPGDAGVVALYADLSARAGRGGDALPHIERALARQDLAGLARARVLFSKGSLFESLKDYDRAFECFRQGNALYDTAQYPLDSPVRAADEIIRAFPQGIVGWLPRATNASELPIFIVGMPRSGTTLIEQILACHPMVFGAGELRDMAELTRGLPGILGVSTPYPGCMQAWTQEGADRAAGPYLEHLAAMGGSASRVTDKMPPNYYHLGLINLVFPRARVVHCVRDPMDTCASMYTMMFAPNHSYKSDQKSLAAAYGAYRKLMDHWRATLDIPILDVAYESLVDDPEPHIRRLLEFCGLPWHEPCLRPNESSRIAFTPTMYQVRNPINKGSIGRWRRYERHLGPLRAALAEAAPAR